MARFTEKMKALKVYGFAVGFYALLAFAIGGPVLAQHKSAAEVKTKFATIRKQAATQKPTATAPSTITGRPVQIQIERLGIDLGIEAGKYNPDSRTWTLNNTEVFVSTLAQPNPVISTAATDQPFVTVFYGHKIDGVIGRTSQLVPGDILHVQTDIGYTFTYYYDHDEIVSPETIDILHKPNATPSVALITCNGAFFQNRRIMYFSTIGQPTPSNKPLPKASL